MCTTSKPRSERVCRVRSIREEKKLPGSRSNEKKLLQGVLCEIPPLRRDLKKEAFSCFAILRDMIFHQQALHYTGAIWFSRGEGNASKI